MSEQVPNRDTELIVYDATGTTRSAELARERLLQAGYTHVSLLAGGLAAWRDAGLPVEADQQAFVTEAEQRDGTYRIDIEKSTLEWIGRNLNKRHYGSIAGSAPKGIVTGELTIRDVSRPLSFPATVAPQQDGSIQAHAAFDIDRTLWNLCYGSCRLFEHLGMHLVHDMISLELFVVARRA